jgi:flagellar basal-body rod protein FlgG
MSIQSLYTAATGLTALQFRLDTIANNLANSGTDGFKRSRANFEDLFYRQLAFPGAQDAQGQTTGTGIAIGVGTRLSSTQIDFREGALEDTGKELDLAIVGPGFFQVNDGGQVLYTRAGNFTLNQNGEMVMASASRGRLLEPSVAFPPDTTAISIGTDGQISIEQADSGTLNPFGSIQLVRFVNPEGLLPLGENLYAETVASGTAITGDPGTNGMGILRQSYLETSNVEPVEELVDLIATQRHFELNSQVIQAADQMLQVISNLRRF